MPKDSWSFSAPGQDGWSFDSAEEDLASAKGWDFEPPVPLVGASQWQGPVRDRSYKFQPKVERSTKDILLTDVWNWGKEVASRLLPGQMEASIAAAESMSRPVRGVAAAIAASDAPGSQVFQNYMRGGARDLRAEMPARQPGLAGRLQSVGEMVGGGATELLKAAHPVTRWVDIAGSGAELADRALERGVSPGRAWTAGATSAGLEALLNKLSLGQGKTIAPLLQADPMRQGAIEALKVAGFGTGETLARNALEVGSGANPERGMTEGLGANLLFRGGFHASAVARGIAAHRAEMDLVSQTKPNFLGETKVTVDDGSGPSTATLGGPLWEKPVGRVGGWDPSMVNRLPAEGLGPLPAIPLRPQSPQAPPPAANYRMGGEGWGSGVSGQAQKGLGFEPEGIRINLEPSPVPGGIKNRNLGRVEKEMDLPQRIAARHPDTAGYLYAVIDDFLQARQSHESRHGEAVRTSLSKINSEKAPALAVLLGQRRMSGEPFTDADALRLGLSPAEGGSIKTLLEDYQTQIRELAEDAGAAAQRTQAPDDMALAGHLSKLVTDSPSYIPFMRTGKLAQPFFDQRNGGLAMLVVGKNKADLKRNTDLWLASLDPGEQQLMRSGMGQVESFNDIQKQGRAGKVDSLILNKIADELGVSDPARLVEYYQLLAAEKHARGFQQRMLKASGIKGYDLDIAASHSDYTKQVAKIRAALRAEPELEARKAKLAEQGGYDDIIDYMDTTYNFAKNPDIAPLTKATRAIGTALAFSADLAQPVIQATQKFTHDLPTMRANYGEGGVRAWKDAQLLATKMQTTSNKLLLGGKDPWDRITLKNIARYIPKGMTPEAFLQEVRDTVRREHDSGIFYDAKRSDFGATMNGTGPVGLREKIMNALYAPIEAGEYNNRLASFLGNYLMIRSKGFRVPQGADHIDKVWTAAGKDYKILPPEDAAKIAARMTNLTQNVGGVGNLPIYQRRMGGAGSITGQFVHYLPQWLEQVGSVSTARYKATLAEGGSKLDAARAASWVAAGALAASVALAGKEGVPLADDAWNLVRGVYNNVYLPLWGDEETAMRSMDVMLKEAMAKNGIKNTAWLKGIPAALGVDISGRAAMSKLLNLRGTTPSEYQTDVAKRVLGAAPSMAWDIATRQQPPRGVANIQAGLSGEVETGEGKVQLDPRERLLMGVGLRPTSRVQEAEPLRVASESKKLRSLTEAPLASKLHDALKTGDTEEVNRILRAVETKNAKLLKEGRTLELIRIPSLAARVREKKRKEEALRGKRYSAEAEIMLDAMAAETGEN